jgi:hypothetical protein
VKGGTGIGGYRKLIMKGETGKRRIQEVENKRRVQEVELGEGCFGRGLGDIYILRKGKGKPSQETGSKSNKAAKTYLALTGRGTSSRTRSCEGFVI